MDASLAELIEVERIITLDKRPQAIFVGDTHGDLGASQLIWERFGKEVRKGSAYLVFLGDYVDRGPRSRENIDFLISKKTEDPEGVILLLGNHEAYHLQEVWPCDFWMSLGKEEYGYYKDLACLPWIVESEDLIAAHGALPFVSDLGELEGSRDKLYEKENDLGLPVWFSLVWGDLNPGVGRMRIDPFTGRPQFGKEIFLEYMDKYDKRVLIRSHQPGAQGWMFEDRALTIFTSQVYVEMGRAIERNIAVVELEHRVTKNRIKVLGLNQI